MPTITTYVSEIRQYVEAELPRCPTALIDQHTVNLVRHWCDETLAWWCDMDPLNVTTGVSDYDLDPPSYAEVIVPIRVQIYETENTPTYWEDNFEEVKFDYSRDEKCVLHLQHEPTEDLTGALRIRIALRPKRGLDADDALIQYRVFEDWYDYWAAGIMARLMQQRNKAWTNLEQASIYQRKYQDGVALARIDETRDRMVEQLQATPRWQWA